MTIKDVITKALLPMSAMVFWLWMVKTIMEVSSDRDLHKSSSFSYSERTAFVIRSFMI